jgi:hypothetical protein
MIWDVHPIIRSRIPGSKRTRIHSTTLPLRVMYSPNIGYQFDPRHLNTNDYLKVRLTLSSLQAGSLGMQWSQSSCTAPSISSSEPGNSGKRMKFGAP